LAVPADQIGRDAVQPGTSVGVTDVVAVTALEGGQEGVRDDVVSQRVTQSPRHITVQGGCVPVE
jgi:hypothetical protein